MGDFQEKEGFGSLFINNYKESDSQPSHKGKIMIDGKVIKLAGWEKQDRNGNTWISLSVDTFEPKKPDGFAQAHKAIDASAPF